MKNIFLPLSEAIRDGDETRGLEEIDILLGAGVAPVEIFSGCVEPTLNDVGEKFAALIIFLPELMLSGRVVTKIQAKIKPLLQGDDTDGLRGRKAVICTVNGDTHDIGKNMVKLMMEVNGFEMHDLGTDVPAIAIIKKAQEISADLICLSGLMVPSLPFMRETIELTRAKPGLEKVKVMVGGGPVTREWADTNGADGYADDAVGAVRMAKDLCGE